MTPYRGRAHREGQEFHPNEERYMSNDHVIVDEIRVALEQDSRLPQPTEVAVSEQAGTASLRGSVASPGPRRAAVRIAKAVAGGAPRRR